MNILDSMKDIVRHTHSLGFVEMVKIIGDDNSVSIESIDSDKTVVIYGTLNSSIEGLGKNTVGLSRIPLLKGFIDFPLYSEKDATIEVIKENRGGEDVPVEIKFDSGKGHASNYRFMSETMANEQIKVPPFKGATWNITIEPERKKIQELSYFQGVLGGFEKRFTVSVDAKNNMNFSVGNGPTDRAVIPFAKDVNGTLKHQWSWPLTQVLSILKLSDNAKSVIMQFSDMGALKIEIDSGLGKYSYILPAVKN